MNKEPLVTIVLLTFNRKHLLKNALDSLINQTYRNLQIIIADNHSEDGTEELCNEYAKKDSRILYIRHEKNVGPFENSNIAYKYIKGDFLVPVNDDDWLDLDYVEKCVSAKVENPDCNLFVLITKCYNQELNLVGQSFYEDIVDDNPMERMLSYISIMMKKNSYISQWFLDMSFIRILSEIQNGTIFYNRFSDDIIYNFKMLTLCKMKVIKNTCYNKFVYDENFIEHINELLGCSNEYTEANFHKKHFDALKFAFQKDDFFKKYYSKKEIKFILKNIKKKINDIRYMYLYDLISFVWRHPFFLFRSGFYERLTLVCKCRF